MVVPFKDHVYIVWGSRKTSRALASYGLSGSYFVNLSRYFSCLRDPRVGWAVSSLSSMNTITPCNRSSPDSYALRFGIFIVVRPRKTIKTSVLGQRGLQSLSTAVKKSWDYKLTRGHWWYR